MGRSALKTSRCFLVNGVPDGIKNVTEQIPYAFWRFNYIQSTMKQLHTRSLASIILISLFSGLCLTANAQQQADPEKLSEEFIWESRTGGEAGKAWIEENAAPSEAEVIAAVTALSKTDRDGIITVLQVQHEITKDRLRTKIGFILTDSGQLLGNGKSFSVALGDLDGDGDLDAMVANFGIVSDVEGEPNAVWTNDGTGTFTNSRQVLGNNKSMSVALGDLDGDGDLDAVVANTSEDQPNTVWTNDGTGTFTNSGKAVGSSWSSSVALGDLDGDGDLDAMFANRESEPNSVWTNDGTGTFTNSGQVLGNSTSTSLALGDLDGDGDLDAMVTNWADHPNTVWTNDGTGTFTNSGQAVGNGRSTSVALGDLDGDGDLDAMIATDRKQPNSVWTNDGTGTFTNSGKAAGSSASFSVALGDFDGDGDLDAMVANYLPGEINNQPNTVWINDGTGTFTNSGQALGNSNSFSVALGDLNGDGDLDAMVGNLAQPNTVWMND